MSMRRLKSAMWPTAVRLGQTLFLWTHPFSRRQPVWLCMVYRARNARLAEEIIAPAKRAGWQVVLWALDDLAPALRDDSVGCGQGGKFDLCNRMLRLRPPRPNSFVVISDDDVRFCAGDLVRFVHVMAGAGLDVAQPVHVSPEHASHEVTLRDHAALARITGYVEIGPVFAFSPPVVREFMPFPDDVGMGWGLELLWSCAADRGVRLGMVDAAVFEHMEPAGTHYSTDEAQRDREALLAQSGLPVSDWRGETYLTWPAYRALAPKSWRDYRPRRPAALRCIE